MFASLGLHDEHIAKLITQALKKEFKNHFRKATRIMDCVACATCRLWGKVQFQGIATALKIIFDLDETTLRYAYYIYIFDVHR
jgi:hypothetical protein